jgi:hypothetical protein
MNPAIHVAIAAAKKKQEEEEQKMTQYGSEDLNGWEFKIVRSSLGSFRNSETLRRLMEEEAANGWEMVEKFDDYRVRFKRRTDRRGLHASGGVDPYRTNFGINQKVLPLVAGSLALLLGLVLFLVQSEHGGHSTPVFPLVAIATVIVAVLVALIVLRVRGR